MPRPRTENRYRFRGSIAPTAAVKRPVRAEVAAPETDGAPTIGKLHIDDVIDSWGGYWGISASEFNEALDELGDVDEIHLHINSPGGEVYEGIAILNSLRRHPANVTAVVDGLAASAASFIAVGVDKTVMAPNTELMIHDAWGIAMGPEADMLAMGARLGKLSNNIASMYAAKAGGSQEDWRSAMLAETWYSADEAVDAGLADEVEGALTDDETPDDEIVPRDAFDLSVFKHAGRAQAPKPGLRTPAARTVAARSVKVAAPGEVACWHTEPGTPCDYNVCRQAEDDRRDRYTARRQARHDRHAAARA